MAASDFNLEKTLRWSDFLGAETLILNWVMRIINVDFKNVDYEFFVIFARKHLCRSLFLINQKEIPAQVFTYEYCEIFQEHLSWRTSANSSFYDFQKIPNVDSKYWKSFSIWIVNIEVSSIYFQRCMIWKVRPSSVPIHMSIWFCFEKSLYHSKNQLMK